MGRMGGVLSCLVQYQANIRNRKQSRRTSFIGLFIGVEENFVFDAMETWGAQKRTLSLSTGSAGTDLRHIMSPTPPLQPSLSQLRRIMDISYSPAAGFLP